MVDEVRGSEVSSDGFTNRRDGSSTKGVNSAELPSLLSPYTAVLQCPVRTYAMPLPGGRTNTVYRR
eukprot:3931669-Rhodomonas_salina.2